MCTAKSADSQPRGFHYGTSEAWTGKEAEIQEVQTAFTVNLAVLRPLKMGLLAAGWTLSPAK